MRIRKEIRKLSATEWNDVVNGMWIMKKTPLDQGKTKYGPQFITYDRMLAKHAHAALNPVGDQAHFGPIFGVFHRAWLLEFENSLLAINKNISGLPYWDCTIDSNLPLEQTHRSIFSGTYMGSKIGQGDTYVVKNGRFASWPIAMTALAYNLTSNIYGFMRHPLSINRSPFVTRHGGSLCGFNVSLPTTQDWMRCLNFPIKNNLPSWDSCVEPYLHAPPHIYLAGSWLTAAQKMRFSVNASEINSENCVQWLGYIQPPAYINLTEFRPYTFIHAYASDCFACPPSQISAVLSNAAMCEPKDSTRLCGPLFSGFLKYLTDSSLLASNSQTFTGDDYYYDYSGTTDMSLQSDKSTLPKEYFQVQLTKPQDIQILGDFGDPAFSPNDPIFPFHHANIDRHLSTWLLTNSGKQTLDELDYLQFPQSGYARGCNLNDIVSEVDPFVDLFAPFASADDDNCDGFSTSVSTIPVDDEFLKQHNLSRYPTEEPVPSWSLACMQQTAQKYTSGPYTVKDIMKYTFALNYNDQLYTYDTIYPPI